MFGLRLCLWITGIACLLAVPGIFMPMSSWVTVTGFFGIELLPEAPIFEYIARLTCATYAGIGIFFILVGLRPLKHGIVVPFCAVASALLGAFCIMMGKAVGMPPKWFYGDGLSALILGGLILVFWLKAKKKAIMAG